ncbi:MAG: DUF1570 domain-containing protein, partial [Planctomycetota bacterium]|nr:DUF1570 domain-containing protein [Planctomycetota bacterium]
MRRGGVLGAVLILAAVVAAQDSTDAQRLAFERELRAVEARIQVMDWERAKRELKALLNEHRERDYVRARRDHIAELMKKCVFRMSYPEPTADGLISGKLHSYTRSTGQIRVRYTPDTMGDFRFDRKLWVHPARFRGPHQIVVDGGLERLVVCADRKAQYIIVLGNEAAIAVARGKKPEVLARAKRPAGPGRIVVTVGRREISLSMKGKAFLRAAKDPDAWGFVALPSNRFKSIVLDGLAEPAWLQGLVDGADQKQLAAFEKTYRPADHLPKWLYAGPAARTPPWTSPAWGWPKLSPKATRVVSKIAAHYKRGEFEAGAEAVKAAGGCLPPAARALLLGSSYEARGRLEEAHAAFARARRLAPDFLICAAWDARVLERLDRYDEALQACETVLRGIPTIPKANVRRISLLLRLDRLDDARSAAAQARRHGVTSPGLQRLQRMTELAERGPTWPRSYEHKSLRYHVASDIDQATCRRAASLLEDAYDLYASTLERPSAGSHRYQVFLFSGQAGYQRFVRELVGHPKPHTGGLYHVLLRQLLIWNRPRRDDMLSTVRHEGFHQYLHRLMPSPPRWFDEGLAEYFQSTDIASERDLGKPRDDHLRLL